MHPDGSGGAKGEAGGSRAHVSRWTRSHPRTPCPAEALAGGEGGGVYGGGGEGSTEIKGLTDGTGGEVREGRGRLLPGGAAAAATVGGTRKRRRRRIRVMCYNILADM